MSNILKKDTIVAIATPPGKGGVGIIRISGTDALSIAETITRAPLKIRYAHYLPFFDHTDIAKNAVIDEGIAIFFKAPHSFTGEDIVELQAHGGPILLNLLLNLCLSLGARMANPGEFSERAFLNNKIDLTQAEAIADLINSSSIQAARNAVRSLQGEFSHHIHELVNRIINLRIYVEAAIDFPDEEIDFLNDGHVKTQLEHIIQTVNKTLHSAEQGRIINEGITVVIAGKPNAGKSSLLNALAGHEAAIVTNIPGTTRDILKENIAIDGIPLHIIDTAGLRESNDIVEQEGIKRAIKAIYDADVILLVVDNIHTSIEKISDYLPGIEANNIINKPIIIVRNKCDIQQVEPTIIHNKPLEIRLSAKTMMGIDLLKQALKDIVGVDNSCEGQFTARSRHINALQKAKISIDTAMHQLINTGAGELVAEDLRYCQEALNEITGEFSNDDLLSKIFTSFCIGK